MNVPSGDGSLFDLFAIFRNSSSDDDRIVRYDDTTKVDDQDRHHSREFQHGFFYILQDQGSESPMQILFA